MSDEVKIPEWRLKEMRAEAVNFLPDEDGVYTWMCERCNCEWQEPATSDYDRTLDHANWPVICKDCYNVEAVANARA